MHVRAGRFVYWTALMDHSVLDLEADEGEEECLEAERHVGEAHHHAGSYLEGTETNEVENVVHLESRDGLP